VSLNSCTAKTKKPQKIKKGKKKTQNMEIEYIKLKVKSWITELYGCYWSKGRGKVSKGERKKQAQAHKIRSYKGKCVPSVEEI
jgi:hypothetical protein